MGFTPRGNAVTASAANIGAYAEIVRERSVLRQLIRISNEVSDTAFQPQGATAQAILDEAERKIFAIAEQQQKAGGPQALKPLLAKASQRPDIPILPNGADRSHRLSQTAAIRQHC